jgi:hypothetical protein
MAGFCGRHDRQNWCRFIPPSTTVDLFLGIGDLHLHVVAAAIHGEIPTSITLIAQLAVINFTQGLQRF